MKDVEELIRKFEDASKLFLMLAEESRQSADFFSARKCLVSYVKLETTILQLRQALSITADEEMVVVKEKVMS